MVIDRRAKIDSRTEVHWRPVIVSWRAVIIRICRRGLIHVKVDFPRNTIFWREPAARSEDCGLNELVRVQRQSPDNVIIGAEIVESSIGVAKDFERHWGGPYLLPIGFNLDTRLGSLDLHKVGHRAIGATFSPRRDSVAAREQTKGG